MTKSGYEWIFAADGTFSVVKNAFMQTPGFNYSIQYSEFGYCELEIPPMDSTSIQKGGSKFRIEQNCFHHWNRHGEDVHLQAMPNYDGSFNVGLILKVTGHNSYEYFKEDYKRFEEFMYSRYPDIKYLIPQMKE